MKPASEFAIMSVINDWIFKLASVLPVKFIGLLYQMSPLTHVTVGMTNIPGPHEELNVLGSARLVEIIPVMGHPYDSTLGKPVLMSVGRMLKWLNDAYLLAYDFDRSDGNNDIGWRKTKNWPHCPSCQLRRVPVAF